MSEVIVTFLNNAQTPTGGVFVISILILVAFISIVRGMSDSSAFKDHALIIVGTMVTVPAIMFLGVAKIMPGEAVSGLLGVIVGYFFQGRGR